MVGELIVIALLLILLAWGILDADIIEIVEHILSTIFLIAFFVLMGVCMKIGWNLF